MGFFTVIFACREMSRILIYPVLGFRYNNIIVALDSLLEFSAEFFRDVERLGFRYNNIIVE